MLAARWQRIGQVSWLGTGRAAHEDQPDRVPGIEPNDYSGLPINEAARMFADSWDVERTTVIEHQCQPYTMPYLFHGPLQFRVWEERQPDTQEFLAIKFYIGTYQQWRTIWMDGRPHPPEYAPHTSWGSRTANGNGRRPHHHTTHTRRAISAAAASQTSDRPTLVEHFMRHGNVLSQAPSPPTVYTDRAYIGARNSC